MKVIQIFKICLVVATLSSLVGCSGVSLKSRYQNADTIALQHQFRKELVTTDDFTIVTYRRVNAPGNAVNIYIEGDGAAWATRYRKSSDPSPRNPLALELAGIDDATNIAYIARPCQFVLETDNGGNCTPEDWTSGRFSEKIVMSIDQAISAIKNQANAPKVNLVGFSGGGAIAVLVAARRDDVLSLRTIAGNLDHEYFTSIHKVSPLADSLNPSDVAMTIEKIPQLHFVGVRDKIIPHTIADNFVAKQGESACSEVVMVEGASHGKGWQQAWLFLLHRPLPCRD